MSSPLGVEWRRISDYEYDFKNPNRDDKNFGSCRFNVLKNIGKDFAMSTPPKDEFKQFFAEGFDESDFASISSDNTELKTSFDVIGLVQRIKGYATYAEAATYLKKLLSALHGKGMLTDSAVATQEREDRNNKRKLSTIKQVSRTWDMCRPLPGSLGENYLISRCIPDAIKEPAIKFHPAIKNKESGKFLPALVFKASMNPTGPVTAIHRIYLTLDGKRKAELENPKMALGELKGSGIWFGTPGPKLYIAEGPENALSLIQTGALFVVSAISSGNMGNLIIPQGVEMVVLAGDNDQAGKLATKKAIYNYVKQGHVCKAMYPLAGYDWNSRLMALEQEDAQQ